MKLSFFILVFLLLTVEGQAQRPSRPSEDSLFGGSSQTPQEAPTSKTSRNSKSVQKVEDKDSQGLDTSHPLRDAFARGDVTDNPLQIGGLYYQRLSVSPQKDVSASQTPISAPLQFDLYMDARPSERVRGFVDERLLYDPTRDANGLVTSGANLGSFQYSSNSAAPSGLTTTTAATNINPQTTLNEAWLKFDIDHAIFVTAGKQHVKWGTSRFWNPTDFLTPQRRDPLLPYDLRLGNTMLKLAYPLEAKKTNFYAITLLDNPQPASTLGQTGQALRAETVLGATEIGIDAIYRGGVAPVYGADVSSPLGPFDVYGELVYYTAPPGSLYKVPAGTLVSGSDISTQFTSIALSSPQIQVSGGLNYSFAWKDNRLATFGLEYFYNQFGYTDPTAYPVLIFLNQYQPFYTGVHYAAAYLTAEGPDAEKHTSYTFSTISNLSDNSFISRIDFSWRFLTYLTFEAYADGHYGTPGGEFTFAMNTPTLTYQTSPGQSVTIPSITIPETLFDFGIGLRLSF